MEPTVDPVVAPPPVAEPPAGVPADGTTPSPVPPAAPAPSTEPGNPSSCDAPAPSTASQGQPHWTPETIGSFEIFHFDSLSEFSQKLRAVDVVTLELDQVEAAGGRAVTDAAHAQNTRVICYTSSGYEDWRDDAERFPKDAMGSAICRDESCRSTWPGEAWGDIRKPSLLAFLGTRADRAAAVGCDGIEFDNMDQAFNSTGLEMSVEQNIDAARRLAALGHERGLAVLAKNAGALSCALAASFDGVFIEECQQFDECDIYLPYRGKLVAMVEYESRCSTRDWAACNEQDDYFDEDGR
ncbi:MAG TPA: endo alpha-1,4 polygalactosaminidase [Polyangiaceae bacterium]|nr:endo alpha-1,4 polygalactosaminidase [Polyangiaceae bacterium]